MKTTGVILALAVGSSLRTTGVAGALLLAISLSTGSALANPTGTDLAVFLESLHIVNQAEIRAGSLAQRLGERPATRLFGKKLADDHRRADLEVAEVARQNHVDLGSPQLRAAVRPLQATLDQTHAALRATKRGMFDQTFAVDTAASQKAALNTVVHGRRRLADRAAKDLADRLAAVLRSHRQIAQDLVAPISR